VLSITANMELIRIGNDCPHTDGIGVYYARNLYNSIVSDNGTYYSFADDCNPSGLYRVAPLANSDFNAELFPNPAINTFTIKLNNKATQPIKVLITDIIGNKVLNLQVEFINGEYTINESLSSGIYLISIKNSSNETVTKKLIVQ
jgi:hypothetical protein